MTKLNTLIPHVQLDKNEHREFAASITVTTKAYSTSICNII